MKEHDWTGCNVACFRRHGNHRHLKIWPEHFSAVLDGSKKAEFRKDDREPRFEAGDLLLLEEFEPDLAVFTDDTTWASVSHVARGGVIPDGYAMLSIVNLLRRETVAPRTIKERGA